jgi:hypothetical protein
VTGAFDEIEHVVVLVLENRSFVHRRCSRAATRFFQMDGRAGV